MRKKAAVCLFLVFVMSFCLAAPVLAEGEAAAKPEEKEAAELSDDKGGIKFDFALNAGESSYNVNVKDDRDYYADVFPVQGTVSKDSYMVFSISLEEGGTTKYLTYWVPKQSIAQSDIRYGFKIWYMAKTNMDSIEGKSLRLNAKGVGTGRSSMSGVWYP